MSCRQHYLNEVVPQVLALPRKRKGRDAALHEFDERRNRKTGAMVNQLLDRYLETLDVEPTIRDWYEGIIPNHLRPALGPLLLSKLDSDILDRFFGQLRRCRERCNGRAKHVKHRAQHEHECDEQCTVVPCRRLSVSSMRQIHWVGHGHEGPRDHDALRCEVRGHHDEVGTAAGRQVVSSEAERAGGRERGLADGVEKRLVDRNIVRQPPAVHHVVKECVARHATPEPHGLPEETTHGRRPSGDGVGAGHRGGPSRDRDRERPEGVLTVGHAGRVIASLTRAMRSSPTQRETWP